jgi:hypothetical protein
MHQQLWGYKVEEKLYVGVREQKYTTDILDLYCFRTGLSPILVMFLSGLLVKGKRMYL